MSERNGAFSHRTKGKLRHGGQHPSLRTRRELPFLKPSCSPHRRRLQHSEELCSAFPASSSSASTTKPAFLSPAASPPTANSFPDITKFSPDKAGARSAWLRPGLYLPRGATRRGRPKTAGVRAAFQPPQSTRPRAARAGVLPMDRPQRFPAWGQTDESGSVTSVMGEQRGEGWGAPATAPLVPRNAQTNLLPSPCKTLYFP